VLQTTAGKMIFGKFDERSTATAGVKSEPPRPEAPRAEPGRSAEPMRRVHPLVAERPSE